MAVSRAFVTSHVRNTPGQPYQGAEGAAGPARLKPRLQRDAGGSRTHFNRVAVGSLAVWLQRHIQYTSRSFSISTWNRTRTWTLGESRAFHYTIEMWGRRLDLHQHHPPRQQSLQRPVPCSPRATSALRTVCGPKQERSDSNTVDQVWNLVASTLTSIA